MRLFTFDPSTVNPGRSQAWTVRDEAVALANAGTSGLAGIILRDGFSTLPGAAVLYVRNDDKHTLAALCAEIVAGLETRKSESGTVAQIINGTSLDLFKRRLADIADRKGAGVIVDGRRRTLASIIAYGCGREDVDMQGSELTPEQAMDAEMSFKSNYIVELAKRLDPWAKVEAGSRLLATRPSISEAETMAALGVKRGDGQLIHRAATAISKHRLTPDRSGRCPSKEEWKAIGDEATAAGAAALLHKYQTETRAKALGLDVVKAALGVLPEGTMLDARALAVAMESRETFDTYIVSIAPK